MTYRIRTAWFVGETGRKLAPGIKKAARQALREIAENPFRGKPLNDELSGFRSHRFLHWRIIYEIDAREKVVTVRDIGPRETVYEDAAAHLARQQP